MGVWDVVRKERVCVGGREDGFDKKELDKVIRVLLERPIDDTERVVKWCEEIFQKNEIPLEESLLLVWQLFFRADPLKATNQECGDNVWMRIGKYRAIILFGTKDETVLVEAANFLLKVVQAGGLSVLLSSCILELAAIIGELVSEETFCLPLVQILEQLACYKGDLVQHKARTVAITLYRRGSGSDLCAQLDKIVLSMEIEDKMRYLLLRDLLEAGIDVVGLTNPESLKPLYDILAVNKHLGCVVADVIVLFALLKSYPLHVEVKDDNGYIGIYLYPRLVKRLPDQTTVLLEELKSKGDSLLYFALYAAMVTGEMSPAPLDMEWVRRALHDYDEVLRNRAFICLCRSQGINTSFTLELGEIVEEHLMDAQLTGSPDGRQQTVTALKYLTDAHFTRLYKLCRDSGPQSPEVDAIIEFWSRIVEMSIASMSMIGHYNKNDLCLKSLQTILDVWRERLAKCGSFAVRSQLVTLHARIIERSLEDPSVLERLCSLVSNSSFDTIREAAGNILRALEYPKSLSIFEKGYFESVLLPMLATQRAHEIDGAAKLHSVYCDAKRNRSEIIERLADELKVEVGKLAADEPETLVNSSVLGLLVALQDLMSKDALNNDSIRIAEYCRKIGNVVTLFVSHPSPEGHYVDEQDDTDGVSNGDLSFSIMTFCWRAVKESSSLLATCLGQIKSSDEEYLMDNGRYLVNLLLRIRHPGAFVAIARPLREVCQVCFSLDQGADTVPDRLLTEAIELCLTLPEIQTTRRSAGLPSCIAAIVTASRDVRRRERLLAYAIEALMVPLQVDDAFTRIDPKPQVIHTINILRQLFRDSTLADDIILYIPMGLQSCFQAFSSPSWAVRNSGTMLFASLMSRTFGVRHDVNEFAACNLVDPRAIHAKCQQILPPLANECFKSTEMLADERLARYQMEFAVYPLLSCIQRFRFSPSGEHCHSVFYQAALSLCLQCLGNDIMKVRKMSVRLLVHMCESPMLFGGVMENLRKILGNVDWQNCNQLHGYLMLLTALKDVKLVDGEAFRSWIELTKKVVEEAGIQCPLIDTLLHGVILPHLSSLTMCEMSIEKMMQIISGRRLPAEDIHILLPKLVDYFFSNPSSDISNDLVLLFESFWREYDLAGAYRLALVKSWKFKDTRQSHRIRYLALTDDDEEVRYYASINERLSVSQGIRDLLRNHLADMEDLIEFEPKLSERFFDVSRRRLFEPEPLNGFKDLAWERRILSR